MTDVYDRQTWQNGEAGGTPISADRLNHVEIGIDDIDNTLQDHDERLQALEANGGGTGSYVGSTADRATVAPTAGAQWFDTDLGQPLWGNGTGWVEADGTPVAGAGGGNAPTNFAAVLNSDNSITFTWSAPAAIDGDDTYALRSDEFPAGITGHTALTTTSDTYTPAVASGVHTFWVTANVDGTVSAASNTAVVTLPYGGGSGTGGGDTPAEILNINGQGDGSGGWWNEGIGFRSVDPEGAVHKDITPDELADGYTRNPYFTPNATNTGVKFRVYCDGARTSTKTKYPRSELRGYNSDGTKQSFSMSSGTRNLSGTTKVLHQTEDKPEICIVQLHDGSDDRFQCRWEDGNLVATVNGGSGDGGTDHDLELSYDIGDAINWRVQCSSNTVKLFIDGDQVLSESLTGSGMYYKVGCYGQSNNRDQDNAASDYHEIELSDLTFTVS